MTGLLKSGPSALLSGARGPVVGGQARTAFPSRRGLFRSGPSGTDENLPAIVNDAQNAVVVGGVPLGQNKALPIPLNQLPLDATDATPNHWTVDGFDQMRSQQQPMSNDHGMLPHGPLGGSMRQPFDYDAALKALQGEQWKPKWWQVGLAALGDAFAPNGGHATQALVHRRDASRERAQAAAEQILKWRHADWENQNEADLRAAAPFTIGRDRVVYDPASGQAQTIYHGPQDFELYAQAIGLQPGTDEYNRAEQDYVLRSAGPSAFERNSQLDDHRTANDASLERLRYGNRVGLENQRQGNRRGMVDYRNAHPAPLRSAGSPRQRVVSVSTPAEAAKLPKGTHYRAPDGLVRVVE